MGDYFFTIDCEGHVDDARVGEALAGLHRLCAEVRFLGSYARHDGKTPSIRPGTTNTDFAGFDQWLRGYPGPLRSGLWLRLGTGLGDPMCGRRVASTGVGVGYGRWRPVHPLGCAGRGCLTVVRLSNVGA